MPFFLCLSFDCELSWSLPDPPATPIAKLFFFFNSPAKETVFRLCSYVELYLGILVLEHPEISDLIHMDWSTICAFLSIIFFFSDKKTAKETELLSFVLPSLYPSFMVSSVNSEEGPLLRPICITSQLLHFIITRTIKSAKEIIMIMRFLPPFP